MKFTDNMSVPLWKISLLQKKQKKKDDEKRKEREAEEERLKKLPPWKRQAEQPKKVIIIDKNKSPNPVDLVELSKQAGSSSSSKSSAKQTPGPLVNGTAQKVDTGESQGSRGRDEPDSGPGVSEEHCTNVHDNVFLTLERKKRRAPPPPKSGSQISVIASNVSGSKNVTVNDQAKPASSPKIGKKTLSAESTISASNKTAVSESVSGNHIHQSSKVNGPSVIGNQTKSSTTKQNDEKKNLKEDVPKPKTKDSAPLIKVGNIVHVSTTNSRSALAGNSAASLSNDSSTSQGNKNGGNKSGESSHLSTTDSYKEPELRQRKKSISELRGLFGDTVTTSNANSLPTGQSTASGTSDKVKSQKTSNDTKPAVTVSSLSKSNNSTVSKSSNQNIVSASGQSVKKEDIKKTEEGKKDVKNGTSKGESKSPAAAAKSPSPSRHKPSSELPASAIISLTNEGPLKSREGKLVRSSSVIDDVDEVTISLESPRSPQNRRISRALESEDDTFNTDTSKQSNGSPARRKTQNVSESGMVNGSLDRTESVVTNDTSKDVSSESKNPSITPVKKVEDVKIEYPNNFRDPNFVSKKEEPSKKEKTSKKEEIPYPADFRRPVSPVSVSTKSQDPVKTVSPKVSSVKDREQDAVTVSKKTSQIGSDTTAIVTDKKVSEPKKNDVKAKESPSKSPVKSDGQIPYPDDFRKPKTQQTASKSNIKDIVKPSDLIKASVSTSSIEKKDDNDNVTVTNIFGAKLRRTKKPESSGISIISQNNDSSKPTVDNSPKAPPSGLMHVGSSGATSTGKKKNVVKKFEKVEFIGYNSPAGKPSALKTEGKTSTRKGLNVSFSTKDEDIFEYMSEDSSIRYYDETHQGVEEDGGKSKMSPQKAKVENGMKNGTLDNSHDGSDEEETSLKGNAPIRSSGGFQNLAAANLSAMDMLLGRGPRPAEPKEEPKPAPPPEPEPEDVSLTPMDGDLFSSAGQGTAALLF
ncbi:nucleolar protein dao-5-like [Lytechinus variegatus]|uniref:nucleolar protein dao-5-like n=1 Tax=Lytechinus variegatus TaxID=7654 RepID=UPI001BB17021|nr:nucleolar protein dao-5-like [Lytechinus variegatus]